LSDGNFTDTQTVFGEVDVDTGAARSLEEFCVTLVSTSGGEGFDVLETLELNILCPDGMRLGDSEGGIPRPQMTFL
jgi:hypothetical protein